MTKKITNTQARRLTKTLDPKPLGARSKITVKDFVFQFSGVKVVEV